LSRNLAVASSLGTAHVRIRVFGHIGPVTTQSFQTYVDLSDAKPGVNTVPVKVNTDPGIQVLAVTPARVRVQVVAMANKLVPVKIHFVGHPASGFVAEAVQQINPSTVQASGPAFVVGQVTQATATIDLSQARTSINGPYRLYPTNALGEVVQGTVTLDNPQAYVDVPIRQLSSYKTLPILVSLIGQPKKGFGVSNITTHPTEITATGSSATLAHISQVTTYPLSLSRHGGGSFTQRVALHLPRGVQSPTRLVTVSVTVAPIETSSSIEIGVTPVNVASGLVVHIRPSRILVTAVGSAAAVHNGALHLRATVNLYGYGQGVFQLAPTVTGASGIQLQNVYPATVTVTASYQ
jgi:YbbR domain-containing protein